MKIEAIKVLIDASTPGVWQFFDNGCVVDPGQWSVWVKGGPRRVCLGSGHPDGKLIAASRELMPKLLRVAEAANRLELEHPCTTCPGMPNSETCAICAIHEALAELGWARDE